VSRVRGDGHCLDQSAILVIDEREMCRLLKAVLSRQGANMSVATSVDTGLALLRHRIHHAFVCDIRSEVRNPITLARAIRCFNREHGQNIPVIALTDQAVGAEAQDESRGGFKACLPKPFEPSELVAILGSILTERRGQFAAGSHSFAESGARLQRSLAVEIDRDCVERTMAPLMPVRHMSHRLPS
jgi:CheY-like chemotaxis protein